MISVDDILCDDWPFVQIVIYKMRSCSYKLNSSAVSLRIGFGTYKCWQERMVYIYYSIRKIIGELRCQDTHIFGQHKIFRIVLANNTQDFRFMLFSFDPFSGYIIKGQIKLFTEIFQVIMIADDGLDIGFQFTKLMPYQQVTNTMVFFSNSFRSP